MTSENKFKIDGLSSDNFGLWVDTLPLPPVAIRKRTEYYTDNDEGGIIPDSTFENIQYPINAYVFKPSTFNDTELRKYLLDGDKLELSCLPNVYYKILAIDSACLNSYDGLRFDYAIQFTLKPFRYAVDNEFIAVESGNVVVNDGNRYSKPVIKIACIGDVNINVNGKIFQLKGIEQPVVEGITGTAYQTVYIDSDRSIVYIDDEIQVGNYNGKFPTLAVGDNEISWTGDVSSVEIQKNTRWY